MILEKELVMEREGWGGEGGSGAGSSGGWFEEKKEEGEEVRERLG